MIIQAKIKSLYLIDFSGYNSAKQWISLMYNQLAKPKVSVLIPCYNVADYLVQCLDSVSNQTLTDIEIICINDGSTDSTLDIIKQYSEKDSRFIIIDKPNEGYGKSMNRGLDVVSGEYVAIVESDDWIESDALELLYNTAKENNADMVKADYVFVDNATGRQTKSWSMSLADNLKNRVFCPVEQNVNIMWTGHPSIWTCLYSKKMLMDNNIRFVESDGAAFQDMGFKVKTFAVAQRFIYIPRVVLYYRKHANNSDRNNSKIFAVSYAHDDVDSWIDASRPDLKRINKILIRCRFANYVWNLRRLSGRAKRDFRKRFQREFASYYKSGEMEKLYFDNKTWLKLLCVINYPNPFWPLIRTFISIGSLIYKTRIRSGYRVHILLNMFVLKKTKLPAYRM